MTRIRVGLGLASIALVGAACSGGGHAAGSASTVVPNSGTLPHGTVAVPPTSVASPTRSDTTPTSPATSDTGSGPSPSTVVDVAGTGSYVLALHRIAGSGPCGAPGVGGSYFGFSVSVTNPGSASEQLARVAVEVNDSGATSSANREVAAIRYSGLCLDFTEPGGRLAAGQTITYTGTASGVMPASVLTAKVISTPDNDTLGSISLTVGS
ncbi:MAG TPA: hypothetical protein VG435_12625 [Acidimicrobiales bacterium]|nr:hypothetical protein [Acidimicrobiales bacterium]